jgi:hypothetical protein
MFEAIKVGNEPRRLASSDDVRAAEASLDVRLPQGYEEFVTSFGEGVLIESGLRVYSPQRILSELHQWRERIEEYWFWDRGAAVLTKRRALECVLFADTVAGDEFILHPKERATIYVLPHESDDIFKIVGGLPSMLDWLSATGVLVERFKQHSFRPFSDSDA